MSNAKTLRKKKARPGAAKALAAAELRRVAAFLAKQRPCCKGKPHSDMDFHRAADWVRARADALVAR
jgi:hypothetical protein